MIFDTLQNRDTYKEQRALSQVLECMARQSAAAFPAERIVLDAEHVFVNPVSFVTKPEAECLYEAHRQYADVHCILEGLERIVVSPMDALICVTPYDPETDIGFYTADTGTVFTLHPGDFLVCYPQDGHKVAIAAQGPIPVKKLVGKIRLL